MEKIRKYNERFFKIKSENRNYSLTTEEMIAFFGEIQSADGNSLFYAITSLFRFGYAKGYRAALAEMKKGGAV